jgi:hypothetical protein
MLRTQCRLFMVGSSLFAVGTAPGFTTLCGGGTANVLCFTGSWFFTSAALIQFALSMPSTARSWVMAAIRAECLSAAIQLVGTLNFNLSTGAAVWAHHVTARREFVWLPDAAGSVAFLVSGILGVVASTLTDGSVRPTSRSWWAAWTGLGGSVAFGASAAGAFVTTMGTTEDDQLAQIGTFVGALCFLIAAVLKLPRR